MTKEYSPFTPGVPVPVEFFTGRVEEVQRIVAAAKRSVHLGTIERLFVSGERGIGKSSLCRYAIRAAEKDLSVLGLHVFLGGVVSLEEMVRRIFERLVQESAEKPWYERIKRFLGNHVKQVGMFGITLAFDASKTDLARAVSDFVPVLRNLLKGIEPERRGIVLVLDDLNGLSNTPGFANWLKSVVDEIATGREPLPLSLALVGLPERRRELIQHQPSLDRVFDLIEIRRFNEQETREFYERAFGKVNLTVSTEAQRVLWRFSQGFPVFMHEIGDAVFKRDEDNQIDWRDAMDGVVRAAQVIGTKYVEPKIFDAIRSDKYRGILKKLTGIRPLGHRFTRQDVLQRLDGAEAKAFNNFIQRMKRLGVLGPDRERGLGHYEFSSELYWLFFLLQG